MGLSVAAKARRRVQRKADMKDLKALIKAHTMSSGWWRRLATCHRRAWLSWLSESPPDMRADEEDSLAWIQDEKLEQMNERAAASTPFKPDTFKYEATSKCTVKMYACLTCGRCIPYRVLAGPGPAEYERCCGHHMWNYAGVNPYEYAEDM